MKPKTCLSSFLLLLGSILISSVSLRAQSVTTNRELAQFVASKDLPEIAQTIHDHTSVIWPKLISDNSESLVIPNGPKPSDLGLSLLTCIQNYEKATPRDLNSSLKAASVYALLSDDLQNSGGYINLCLADAANRLAVARLAEHVINSPENVDQIKKALGGLTCVSFSAVNFLSMIHDEPAQKVKAGVDLSSPDEKTLRDRIFSALSVTLEDVLGEYSSGKVSTSYLIGNLDIPVLLVRMGHTEVEASVNLAGLIEFYKLGGNLTEISASNLNQFKSIMNGRETHFHSDLMNVTQVSPVALILMFRQFKNSEANPFIKMATQ